MLFMSCWLALHRLVHMFHALAHCKKCGFAALLLLVDLCHTALTGRHLLCCESKFNKDRPYIITMLDGADLTSLRYAHKIPNDTTTELDTTSSTASPLTADNEPTADLCNSTAGTPHTSCGDCISIDSTPGLNFTSSNNYILKAEDEPKADLCNATADILNSSCGDSKSRGSTAGLNSTTASNATADDQLTLVLCNSTAGIVSSSSCGGTVSTGMTAGFNSTAGPNATADNQRTAVLCQSTAANVNSRCGVTYSIDTTPGLNTTAALNTTISGSWSTKSTPHAPARVPNGTSTSDMNNVFTLEPPTANPMPGKSPCNCSFTTVQSVLVCIVVIIACSFAGLAGAVHWL